MLYLNALSFTRHVVSFHKLPSLGPLEAFARGLTPAVVLSVDLIDQHHKDAGDIHLEASAIHLVDPFQQVSLHQEQESCHIQARYPIYEQQLSRLLPFEQTLS